MESINWLSKLADWGWAAFWGTLVAAFGWIFYMERKITSIFTTFDSFKLHVAENYVKKSDMSSLKDDFSEELSKSEGRTNQRLSELKDSTDQILDILLQQKIGTTKRRG